MAGKLKIRLKGHGSLGSANQAAGPGKSGSSGQVVAGHVFKSQTDTETIPHLIEDFLGKGLDFKEACRQAFLKLKGRNAFLALHAGTGELVAARKGSPLIVGVVGSGDEKEKEVFIASDVPAFLLRTNKVMYLDDGEMVSALHGVPRFYNTATGAEVKKRVVEIGWEAEQAEKGEYPHFMIKEIMEQKDTIARAINQPDSEIEKVAGLIARAKEVFFVGCGTAARVCHTAEYMFSGVAGKQVRSVPASEFWNYRHFLTKDALVVAISQSGETADTMEALEVAKAAGAKIVSLVNVQGSSMTRLSDYVFMINAGPEKAVASTKATTAQMAIVLLLAYAVAGKLKEGKRLLVDIAAKVNDMLNPRYVERIKELAERLRQKKNIFIIGRGFNYPMALESAIKIMEVSYIHAQGFAGGEMKHGPIALIERGSPVIVLTANDPVKHETISNAVELKARGAFIIGVGPENEKAFDYWIKTPEAGTAASPIVNIIPVQVLAYYLSIFIGNDPDFPKHLAKAVTVK